MMLRNIFQLMKSKGPVAQGSSDRTRPGTKRPLIHVPIISQGGKTRPLAKAEDKPSPPPALSASEQTMELLQQVEPEDILELMFPRLILEHQRQLEAVDQELAQIDKRLEELHLRRDDVMKVNSRV